MSASAIERVNGIEEFSPHSRGVQTLIEGLESFEDFDRFTLHVAKQLLSLRHHGNLDKTEEYEGSDTIWANRKTNGRQEYVTLAARFESRPLRGVLQAVNPRIFVTGCTEGYLDPDTGRAYPRRMQGRTSSPPTPYRTFTRSVNFVALTDLVLPDSDAVVGAAGLTTEEGFNIGYSKAEISRQVKGAMRIHDSPHLLFPSVIPETVT